MKKLFLLLLISVGCNAQKEIPNRQLANNQEEAFVDFFKIQVYCSCLKHGYENKQIMELIYKEDLLGGYDGLANDLIQEEINTIGKQIASTIKPETYLDFENKKRITATCLNFYNSKDLDSLAKSIYEKYK